MADKENAEGTEADGNTEFSDEFARLAREEQGTADLDAPDPLAEKPAVEEEPAGQEGADADPPEGTDAEKPAVETQDDIWATADPKLREAFEAERDRAAKAEQAVNTQSGRASAAQRELNNLRQKLAPARDAEGAADQGKEAKDREERMKQLREEYPDVAGPLLDELARMENRVAQSEALQVEQARSQNDQLADQEEAKLIDAHPDWSEITAGEKGKAFLGWVNRQPRYVQDAVTRNGSEIVDSAEVIDILNRYKGETQAADPAAAELAAKRQRQLAAARQPGASRVPVAAGSVDDFDAEWKRLAAIDARKGAQAR